jgi:hypothetical protein
LHEVIKLEENQYKQQPNFWSADKDWTEECTIRSKSQTESLFINDPVDKNDKLQSSNISSKNSNQLKWKYLSISPTNSISTFPYNSMQVVEA